MKYIVIWERTDGANRGEIDEPFDTRAEAEVEVERMKAEDRENGEADMWCIGLRKRKRTKKMERAKRGSWNVAIILTTGAWCALTGE